MSRPSAPAIPRTYAEARTGFRGACAAAGVQVTPHSIEARGPAGEELAIDVAALGDPHTADRVLMLLSGVHGVEGFANSVLQARAVERWSGTPAAGTAVVFVHGVNPWGMAWLRRQNESNVDLNRNWGADRAAGPANVAYAELHDALCPTTATPPSAESLFAVTRAKIGLHGYDWVKRAVTEGQRSHPDGLYYAGDGLEASTRILAAIAEVALGRAAEATVIDLHTGHGGYGEVTLLPTASAKPGQLANGLAEVAPEADFRSVTVELGTRSDTTMILAERAEHWVHRNGDRGDPEHAAIVRHHLCCSTPDDEDWAHQVIADGDRVIDQLLDEALRS